MLKKKGLKNGPNNQKIRQGRESECGKKGKNWLNGWKIGEGSNEHENW